MNRLKNTVLAAVLGCALTVPLATTPAAEPTAIASTAQSLAPQTPGRIAFTDDVDHLQGVQLQRDADSGQIFAGGPSTDVGLVDGTVPVAATEHVGEAGGSVSPPTSPLVPATALVSTAQTKSGEVYVGTGQGYSRITCNKAVETHPVVFRDSPTEWSIAYATNADGDWDIVVATGELNFQDDCSGITYQNVTDESGARKFQELWPAWTVYRGLVYSSTRGDPFGDIFHQAEPGGGPAQNLTQSPGIPDEQPAVTELADLGQCYSTDSECFPNDSLPSCSDEFVTQTWVAYVTSPGSSTFGRVAHQRHLALVELENPTHKVSTDIAGTEPTWSGCAEDPFLAWTTKEDDPYGDVVAAAVEAPDSTEGSDPGIDLVRDVLVAGEPGVAESHPAWQGRFGVGDDEDVSRVVYTSRTVRHDLTAGQVVRTDADITDAQTTDGSDRTTLVARTRAVEDGDDRRFDEASPAWSPDGGRIAFSSDVRGNSPGREIVVSDADGTAVTSLAEATQRVDLDFDSDPVWSPDGTRIAFVRQRYQDFGSGETFYAPPVVWIVDLRKDTAFEVTAAADLAVADVDPTWSPDGRHLVVARSHSPQFEFGPGLRAGPTRLDPTELWVLRAEENGAGAPLLVEIECDGSDCGSIANCDWGEQDEGTAAFCRVSGRSPAWSPDGTSIAYTDGEALKLLVGLTGPTDTDFTDVRWPDKPGWSLTTRNLTVLIGYEDGDSLHPADNLGPATETRAVIADADDPTWSPDGTEIAFAGTPTGQPDQRDIWAIAPKGTGLRQVTHGRGPDTEPTWKSDVADLAVTLTVTGSPAQAGEAVSVTAHVTNNGPKIASGVELATTFGTGATLAAVAPPAGCRSNSSGCTVSTLAPGASFDYQVEVRHEDAISATATAAVTTRAFDPVPANDSASAQYVVGPTTDLRVSIDLDDNTGYVGGSREVTYRVRNVGPRIAEDVGLSVGYPDHLPGVPDEDAQLCEATLEPCDIGTLEPGQVRTFTGELATPLAGSGRIRAVVGATTGDSVPADNVARKRLKVLQPTVRLLPGVAHPGQVVLAYGEDMPPGTDVEVAWAPGITVEPGPYPVDEDGTMRASLLIIRHDRLLERVLTATSTTDDFTPVTGSLLVVPRSSSAPGFLTRG